jgi:hypothetical protein
MIEPFPNAFSMDETASSIAFSFSGATGIVFPLSCGGRIGAAPAAVVRGGGVISAP